VAKTTFSSITAYFWPKDETYTIANYELKSNGTYTRGEKRLQTLSAVILLQNKGAMTRQNLANNSETILP